MEVVLIFVITPVQQPNLSIVRAGAHKALLSDQKNPAIPNRNPAEDPSTTAYDAFFGIDNIVHIVIEAENEEQALEKAKQLLESDGFEQTITEIAPSHVLHSTIRQARNP